MIPYIVPVFCVLGLAVGQILFKVSALSFAESGFFALKTITAFSSAICLYGITSLAWVWILQKVELGRIYPIMALAFVIVPIGSNIAFGEKFTFQYFVGVAIIITGIIVAVKA